jgi:hypothetical protein
MAQQINLYDPALRRQHDWLALGNVLGLAGVLAIGVAAAGYVTRLDLPALNARIAQQETQLTTLRNQIATLGQQASTRKPDARLEQEIASKRQLLGMREEVRNALRQNLSDAAGNRFTDYLLGFARQTVNGLWLTAFNIDAVSGSIEIKGCTTDPALLPEYIRRLNHEAAIQGRAFSALKLTAIKTDKPEAAPRGTSSPASACALGGRNHEFILIPVKTGAGVVG